MRICHVCSGHSADDGRVFHRACVTLAAARYDVHLVAVGNGTHPYVDRGVTIHPLPGCRDSRQRLARRARVARMAAAQQPDLFHVHEPELLGPTLACAQSRPVIYDVHESYLDVLLDRDWIPRVLRPMARFAWDRRERHLVRRCAGVIAATERIAQRYHRLHGTVEVVANYPQLTGVDAQQSVTRDGRTCVFAGALGSNRGLEQAFAALAILKRRGLAVPIAIAGSGSNQYLRVLWREADRLGIRELVTYHGVLSKSDTIMLQQRASIGLVLYQPIPNNMRGMPNKLVECMGLALPVVFSDFPSYSAVAGVIGAGIAVDPTEPAQIADSIERLVKNPELARQMGASGRRAVRERLNWRFESFKMLDLYHELLGPRSPGAPVRDERSIACVSG